MNKTILIILLILLIANLVLPYFYFTKGWFKWYYHNILDWHQPSDKETFDGCSFHCKCKYCGKEIMQDSQGNWF